jgi:PAS domain S-box-containing protein
MSDGLISDGSMLNDLRERIAELEAENAALRHLDDTLRRNIRLFEALIAQSHDGIVLVTPQLTSLRLAHSILGISDREIAGQSILSVIHPEDAGIVQAAFDRLMSGMEKSLTCECRGIGSDGIWHWLEIQMTDLLDDPDVQAIVFNNRNIDKRKKYQQAMEELVALQARPA